MSLASQSLDSLRALTAGLSADPSPSQFPVSNGKHHRLRNLGRVFEGVNYSKPNYWPDRMSRLAQEKAQRLARARQQQAAFRAKLRTDRLAKAAKLKAAFQAKYAAVPGRKSPALKRFASVARRVGVAAFQDRRLHSRLPVAERKRIVGLYREFESPFTPSWKSPYEMYEQKRVYTPEYWAKQIGDDPAAGRYRDYLSHRYRLDPVERDFRLRVFNRLYRDDAARDRDRAHEMSYARRKAIWAQYPQWKRDRLTQLSGGLDPLFLIRDTDKPYLTFRN